MLLNMFNKLQRLTLIILSSTLSSTPFSVLLEYVITFNDSAYTGWRRKMGKFEVDYEIPPRSQVPSAHAYAYGFVTLKRLVRL
jgi:hypothetical protein